MLFCQMIVERNCSFVFGRKTNHILKAMLSICLAISLFCVTLSAASAEEKLLFKHLFEDDGYVPEVRPRLDPSTTIDIKVDLEVNQIQELNEQSQTLHTVGFIQSEWIDDYLQWNPDNYSGIQEFVVPPKKLWLPDFGIQNSVETFYQEDFFEYFRAHVNYTGRVVWAFGGLFQTSCRVETVLFPFDSQRCSIVIENWAYTNRSVTLVNGSVGVKLDTYHENGIWDLTRSEMVLDGISYGMYPDETYSQIEFVLYLQRKPRYYLVNIVIPCTFLTSIALLVFWLSPEAGEKVSLGVTVLLAFSVFQLIIAGSTPENSDSTPVLSIFVTLTMALSTVSVLTTVMVLHLHHRESYQRVPKWLQAMALNFLPRVMCMTLAKRSSRQKGRFGVSTSPNNACPEEDGAEETAKMTLLDVSGHVMPVFASLSRRVEDVTAELKLLTSRICEKEFERESLEEWQAVAKVLDRLLFWIVLVVLVVSFRWLMSMSIRAKDLYRVA